MSKKSSPKKKKVSKNSQPQPKKPALKTIQKNSIRLPSFPLKNSTHHSSQNFTPNPIPRVFNKPPSQKRSAQKKATKKTPSLYFTWPKLNFEDDVRERRRKRNWKNEKFWTLEFTEANFLGKTGEWFFLQWAIFWWCWIGRWGRPNLLRRRENPKGERVGFRVEGGSEQELSEKGGSLEYVLHYV